VRVRARPYQDGQRLRHEEDLRQIEIVDLGISRMIEPRYDSKSGGYRAELDRPH